MKTFFDEIGILEGQHLIVHSSFRKFKTAFPSISIKQLILNLQNNITKKGSLIFPTFSYCFKKSVGESVRFDKLTTPSEVGAVSEEFRKMKDVVRTSSPTHSFALWGDILNYFDETNSPGSPLGKGSILEWLAFHKNSFILLLGCDFSTVSFIHFLEVYYNLPYINFSPWDYLDVLPYGLSVLGKQKLNQIPGCSKSFVNFEHWLADKKYIQYHYRNELKVSLISSNNIFKLFHSFIIDNPVRLLCPIGYCTACTSRIKYLKEINYV